MNILQHPPSAALLGELTQGLREILSGNLVGVYLHGSSVMGCFHPNQSDIDLLIVVQNPPQAEEKRRAMELIVLLNRKAPPKGLEMSVVCARYLSPFVYPTPYELHFSNAHLARWQEDPEGYLAFMQGTDPDLAAHCTILWHRGRCLFGPPIHEVFSPVPESAYRDSLKYDLENAAQDILVHPMYVTFSLCRVLAFDRDGLILSKREGALWALENVPGRFHPLIQSALAQYEADVPMDFDPSHASAFAAWALHALGM